MKSSTTALEVTYLPTTSLKPHPKNPRIHTEKQIGQIADNATLGQVVQGRAVSEMPLNGRNIMALVGLIPGVVPGGTSNSASGTSSTGNLTGQNIFAAGNFQISGGSGNQSATLLDGAPVNIIYAHGTVLVPSQDSIQEFKVQTSSNTAEFGNYTGGVINMATKSGTGQNSTPGATSGNPFASFILGAADLSRSRLVRTLLCTMRASMSLTTGSQRRT
jgi:hypothetical protein